MIPAWLAGELAARGICADCHCAPGMTFWQSLTGPLLCWSCCDRRRAAIDDRYAA